MPTSLPKRRAPRPLGNRAHRLRHRDRPVRAGIMSDLVVALGLVLVIEGLLWSLFPGVGRKLLAVAAGTSESSLRMAGAVAVALGVAVVWLVRG